MPQLNPEFYFSQLFWLLITFSFLLIFLWRISLPRIGSVLEKRRNKIKDDIESAKKMQVEAEKINNKINEQLRKAQNNADDLLKKTVINLQHNSQEQIKNIENELSKKIQESGNNIKKNKNEAIKKIDSDIYQITNMALSKLINSNFDEKKINDIIEKQQSKSIS